MREVSSGRPLGRGNSSWNIASAGRHLATYHWLGRFVTQSAVARLFTIC
jgi:hypothetical protein